jgi:hypothetical protein
MKPVKHVKQKPPVAARRRLRRRWQNATATAAVAGAVAIASGGMPGADAAPSAATGLPSPTTLLGPPVIVNGGDFIGYMMWVRTPAPIGEDESGVDLEVSVPSLGLRGSIGRHGTPPTRSAAGGWCVRIGVGGYKLKNPQSDPPRVVTVYVKGTDGLKQTAYARLQTSKGGSAAAAGVPRAQSGCRKNNSGGPG